MPDANGKLMLQDYEAALIARGFDGFTQPERYQMINFGYRAIARNTPWSWEETSHAYVVAPGAFQIPVSGGTPLTPDDVKSIIITSPDANRSHLLPMREDRFIERWLSLDLAAAANRGITFGYVVYVNNIWLLPPPQVQTTYTVYFSQYLPDMVLATDVPATPQMYDEIVLDAALDRCHRRAHELQLAGDAEGRVQQAMMDMLADDVWTNQELQDRVSPDDQWL